MRCVRLPGVILILLIASGCQKTPRVDLDYSFKLAAHERKFALMTASDKDEPVTVTSNSNNAKIDLYILKAQSEDEAMTIIDKQSKDGILMNRLSKVNPQFETVLAAHTRYVLGVESRIDANVYVKITSR